MPEKRAKYNRLRRELNPYTDAGREFLIHRGAPPPESVRVPPPVPNGRLFRHMYRYTHDADMVWASCCSFRHYNFLAVLQRHGAMTLTEIYEKQVADGLAERLPKDKNPKALRELVTLGFVEVLGQRRARNNTFVNVYAAYDPEAPYHRTRGVVFLTALGLWDDSLAGI